MHRTHFHLSLSFITHGVCTSLKDTESLLRTSIHYICRDLCYSLFYQCLSLSVHGYKTYNYSKAMYRYTYQRAVFESERGSPHDRHEKPSQQARSKRLESPTYLNENYSTLPLRRAYLCAKSPPLHAGNCYFLTKDQLRTHMTGYSQPLPANSSL